MSAHCGPAEEAYALPALPPRAAVAVGPTVNVRSIRVRLPFLSFTETVTVPLASWVRGLVRTSSCTPCDLGWNWAARFFPAGTPFTAKSAVTCKLLESSPAANTKITGTDVPVKLRFNVRIDVSRSRLILVHPDGSQQALTIKKDTAADIVASDAAGLVPGAYRLRWQVLASDGHITRGEVLFAVAGA